MKKKSKLLKIVVGVIVASVVLVVIGIFSISYIEKKQQKQFTPLQTQEVEENIFVIQDDYVNAYFIKDQENKYIAIDTGVNSETVKTELKKLSISPEDVSTVFLTHSDFDHVGGASLFKNAVIYLPQKELPMIDGSTYRGPLLKNKATYPYKTIQNDQVINQNNIKIKAFLTKGHTKGHTSYIINDKYIFVGDTLSLKKGKVSTFNKLANMDEESQKRSISKMKDLKDIQYIFTHHYGYSKNFEQSFTNWKP